MHWAICGAGLGEYRDRVLAFFKNVKFGPGLRFFEEPFTSKMDFTGEFANLVPDSPASGWDSRATCCGNTLTKAPSTPHGA